MADLKSELIQILRERSYREGDFTLASGRKSKYYIDVKTTSLWPRGADLIGRLAVEKIAGIGKIHALAGLTLGADPILTAVSLAGLAQGKTWPALIVRKEPKKKGTEKYIEGIENVASGSSVLMIEDVVTTGDSGLLAAKRCRESGYQPVGVLTVVDRQDGGEEAIAAQGLKLFSLLKLSDLRV
jgi:orotate phosphoribosyltransferase